VLNSGIYGFVSAVEDEWLWLDVAEKVEIRVAKGSIARKISANSKPAE
jgi:preprotein translocase subunit YajC